MATSNPNILFQVIDDSIEGNIQGELDVYNPKKFPLAITFTIKDVMDMTSSKGSFSKSFKIPATSNNNEVLKFLISASFYDSFQYVEGKKARIFVDGNLILEGAFQLKGHGVFGTPEYYECLVFGDNFKWVNAIDKLNLCEIDLDAGNLYPNTPQLLIYGRQQIMDTWDYSLSGELIGGVGTHVTYPLVNTGKWTYGNFVHPDDMAPAIFVLDVIRVILAAQGYTLQSNFMETNWFKKLVSVTPKQDWQNSDEILLLYQFEYEQGEVDGSIYTDWKIPWDFREAGTSTHAGKFYGQFRNLSVVCPTCDPSSLINKDTWIDNYIDVGSTLWPAIGGVLYYYSGWYWGAYGYDAGPIGGGAHLTSLVAKNPGGFLDNLCNSSNPFESVQYHGTNWDCIWLNAAPVPNSATSMSGGYSRPFENSDRFTTNFFGTYEFNGGCDVEMDNTVVINNVAGPYDPWNGVASANHLINGFNYTICGGQVSNNPPEFIYLYTEYHCQLFVMHYEKATNRVNVIPVDADSNGESYCIDSPLPASNLTFTVNFQGLEIDILDADDYVYYYVEVNEVGFEDYNGGFSGSITPTSITQCKYRMKKGVMNGGITEAIVDGGSINIGNLLPCDVTQLEWLNGLTGMFNLYWQSDEMTKTIYVEPRDMFFEGVDTAIDWSDKLNWGERQTSKYIYDALKRNLCFTYENDGQDAFVEERNRRKGQICELGAEVMDLGELFVNEDDVIGSNYYAPSYMFYDKVIATNTSNAPFIPVIHSEYTTIWNTTSNNDYPDKIDEHKARILLWGGKTPLNHADGFSNTNKWRWGKMNPSATPDELNYYPFAGVYCDQDEEYFGSLNLAGITYFPQLYYQNVTANMIQPAPSVFPECPGLYEVFWQRNIENLIDRPKILTAKFLLTSADISMLKLQKLIYIENSESSTYYIINKIVDFKPAQAQLTKVELFEWILAKPAKRLSAKRGQQYGPDKDSGIGQVGSNKRRLEKNFASILGITNTTQYQVAKTPNLVLTTPTTELTTTEEKFRLDDPTNTRWTYQKYNGAITTKRASENSFNLGNNNTVIQNDNNITVGSNNRGFTQNGIVIGKNNNTWSETSNAIEFHVGQGNPALVISETGEVLQGGGGFIVFEDINGNFTEVWTEISELGETNYKRILKTR